MTVIARRVYVASGNPAVIIARAYRLDCKATWAEVRRERRRHTLGWGNVTVGVYAASLAATLVGARAKKGPGA